jgi:hypothetical protein
MIPGLEVQHTVEIQSRRCSWLKRLAASTDYDTRGFIFKYNIEPSKDGSVWHRLLGLSTILLDALRQARPCEVGVPVHFRPSLSNTCNLRTNDDLCTSFATA